MKSRLAKTGFGGRAVPILLSGEGSYAMICLWC